MTERTLINLRHVLETNYVRSTVEGASEEERALYSPEAIAKCELIAMQDNALSIARWARAICIAAHSQKDTIDAIAIARRKVQSATDTVNDLKALLEGIKAGRSYPSLSVEERERQAQTTAQTLQRAEKDLAQKQSDLRYLSDTAPQTDSAHLGTTPHQGQGEVAAGRVDLVAGVQNLPHADP